jgi:hypothetical protein
MKIGYKGFDKDLKCKGYQFTVGEVAALPEVENPKLCSNQGFHYCNTLLHVFNHYNEYGTNRFCEIEILGKFTDDHDKSITTSLRVIRELSKEDIKKVRFEDNMKLKLVRSLQEKYPLLHVGGSIGLFLHGIRLDRWDYGQTDIDFVSPYFFLPESFEGCNIQYQDCKPSGNDFDETFIAESTKVDVRIDPKQRYQIIEYNGFRYKVSIFETILAAKVRYSAKNDKHKEDIREMCGLKEKPAVATNNDLPW